MDTDTTFDHRFSFPPDSNDGLVFTKLYLSSFDTDLFSNKQMAFGNIDVLNADNIHIRQKIRDVMTFNNRITGQNYYYIPTWSYIYNKGTPFYRVRKIKESEIIAPYESIKCWDDVWNPPTKYITSYGRLNYPHESLLYTTPFSPEIAIKEMKITPQDKFALIKYEAIEDIIVTIAGFFQENSALTTEENQKCKVLTNFFHDNITKDISLGDEHLYKIPANIIKECYTDYTDNSQVGWVYPSIASKKGFNVCFKPEEAKKKLKLKGTEICKLDNKYDFIIYYVIEGLEENSTMKYHLIGSEIQKSLYPHISLTDTEIVVPVSRTGETKVQD